MFLTLTAGMWGGALAAFASSAWCTHDMIASEADAAPASDEHDCCRARFADANAPHSGSEERSHHADATRAGALSQTQPNNSHAEMDCARARGPESESKVAAAFGERGRSCLECCAGRANQTPITATFSAPEQSKMKRDGANARVNAHDLFAPDAHGVSHLTPSQHAPPVPAGRRHALISVFLI
jgi:hypothetical protein